MVQPESKIKKDIKRMIVKRGGCYFPCPGGSYGMDGAPDLVACYRGRFIAVEGKTPHGDQQESQKVRERWVLASGGIYTLGRSVEMVEDVLDGIDKE